MCTACAAAIAPVRCPRHVRPWARKTVRLEEALQSLGMRVGGRGARALARRVGMSVSAHTVLRLRMVSPEPVQTALRVLGVDDFGATRCRRGSCTTFERRNRTWSSAFSTLAG
jgi:hypothetical protein